MNILRAAQITPTSFTSSLIQDIVRLRYIHCQQTSCPEIVLCRTMIINEAAVELPRQWQSMQKYHQLHTPPLQGSGLCVRSITYLSRYPINAFKYSSGVSGLCALTHDKYIEIAKQKRQTRYHYGVAKPVWATKCPHPSCS